MIHLFFSVIAFLIVFGLGCEAYWMLRMAGVLLLGGLALATLLVVLMLNAH
jgi:hypothetical protein